MDNMQNKKKIFQHLNNAIGLKPKVVTFYDEPNVSKIDIYIGEDRPDFGITTYSTIGLSEHSIGLKMDSDEEIRVEFIGICNSDVIEFPNIIASCAFNIINDQYGCKPGTVYPDVIHEYYDDLEMEHIFFTTPYLWDDLTGLHLGGNYVTWLMAVPISNAEFEFLRSNGSDALEDLLEKSNIDVFDILRKSVA
jgi:hypothetical protein